MSIKNFILSKCNEFGTDKPLPSYMFDDPISENDLIKLERELSFKITPDIRSILKEIGAITLYGTECSLSIFPICDQSAFNIGEDKFLGLDNFWTFGTDDGDIVFFMDHKNILHKGNWAIFAIEMGSTFSPEERASYMSGSLEDFLNDIVAGKEVNFFN